MRLIALGILAALLPACAAAQSMTFRAVGNGGNCADCAWIAAEGTITEAAADALARLLAEPFGPRIVFDSPGGELGAALRMGRMLREAGRSTGIGRTEPGQYGGHTVVEGRCESACAFAYMGGESRRIDEPGANEFVPLPGRLGMHRFYAREGNEIPTAATQQIMGQLLIFVQDMGVDPRVLSLASTAAEDDMYYFSPRELRELRLVTTGSRGVAVPVIRQGGLALEWTVLGDNGRPDRTIEVYCRGTDADWMLRVTNLDAVSGGERAGTGFGPLGGDSPFGAEEIFNDLHIEVGGTRHDMARSAVLAEESNGRDLRLTVRLPVDPRDHAEQEYRLITTRLRMAVGQYWAGGTLPDAGALSVLARACPTD